jgi:hypothetical protein
MYKLPKKLGIDIILGITDKAFCSVNDNGGGTVHLVSTTIIIHYNIIFAGNNDGIDCRS